MKEIKTKSFGKSKVFLPLPPLIDLEKRSWDAFWEKDIKELFREISPIRDYTGEELELWFLDYKLGQSKYKTDLEAKENDDSYEAPLRATVRLVNLKTKEEKKQEIFLADFPLMTERGTFVINGVERVVISQLIRSPGAFFTLQKMGKNCFGAKIIPNRGAWLEFGTEPSGFIGVKIDRRRKVAATTLLRAFGLEKTEEIKKIFEDLEKKSEIKYIDETLKRDFTQNQAEALIEIYSRLRPGDVVTPDGARSLIFNMFFNFERYDLSKVGRWRMNQRLGGAGEKEDRESEKEVLMKDRVLKLEDVQGVIREIIRLNITPGALPDQIDHLGNRRVRTLSEFLQNRLRVGLMRMERIIKDRMSTLDITTLTPVQLINSRPFMAAIKEFFTSSQIAQFMDNVNPLAELEHKRRLSATGPGGLSRQRAGFEVRDVQPSHYGRICPIETPEGPNIGLVGHLASFARVNPYGFIETPYFQVEKGKIKDDVQYLNAYQEERYNIASGGVPIDSQRKIAASTVEGRIRGEPGVIDKEKVDFADVSSEQSISVATSLIPFLQNDDANRALMGSNMQRQAVSLIRPEPPLVSTGVEKIVARDSGQIILAEGDGIVSEVDANHIVVESKGKKRVYNLKTFKRTNQYTCFHQVPIVKKNQKVKEGEPLIDGGAIAQGRLALGHNALVAFMPWRGATYEDAVVISERLVKNDKFASIHIEDFNCDIRETKLGPEVTTRDIPNAGEEQLKDLDQEGIVRVGAEVGPNDILVGKISPKGETEESSEERLLRAVFGEKAKEVKDTSLRMEHGKRGRVTGVKVFERAQGCKLQPGVIKRVRVEVSQLRKVTVGDKLSGRHGNKGVISRILPEEEMPFMEDGTPVDVVLNPLSVVSRMNLGQILETHLGWAAKRLGYVAVTPALSGATSEDIKAELKKAGLPEDGKIKLYDGRSGILFSQRITVGYIYLMKLVHMVEDKIHMRSIGPYSLITQQPLGGKAQFGGQRFGEMEVWALEGYGAAHTLQEMLTIKSDDIAGRRKAYESILKGDEIETPGFPASFNLLLSELKSLGLNVEIEEKAEDQVEKPEDAAEKKTKENNK